MHNFGAVHFYEFKGGPFKCNPKVRPCMVMTRAFVDRGLHGNVKICARSTRVEKSRKEIQEGRAFTTPKGTRTEGNGDFRFSEDGVFILRWVQLVPTPALALPTYCGMLPKHYVQEAQKCASNCDVWRANRSRPNRKEHI